VQHRKSAAFNIIPVARKLSGVVKVQPVDVKDCLLVRYCYSVLCERIMVAGLRHQAAT